jgi:hypothetical protein
MLSDDQEMAAREAAEKVIRETVAAYVKEQHVASFKAHVPDSLVAQIAVAVVDVLLQPEAEAELAHAARAAMSG